MRPRSCLVLLAFCVLVATPVMAQENTVLFPRFGISGGGYLGDFGTTVRVDPHIEGLQGTKIDLEKNLGLQSTRTLSRFELQWRPFRRHELGLSYFRTERTGLRTIDRKIVFEDTTFPIRASVRSAFNIDFWEASYTYWARQGARDGLGINFGVTGLQFHGELSATNDSSGSSVTILDETVSSDVPVPVIGLEGRYQFTGSLMASARASFLPSVSIRDYRGEAYTAKGAIEYRAARNVGLGVGYNYFNLNGVAEKPNFHADLGMTVSGFEGFVHLVFGR